MSRAEFRERIRASLANETLQSALDANAERRMTGRIAAFASLPDWRERRQQAHAVRAGVIERLEQYLEKFIGKAEANGIVVHRARDAAEAIQIILAITDSSVSRRWSQRETDDGSHGDATQSRRTPVLVAKSKSMVTEEIHLNHALEAQGMRVVETDLGEYIVQLRGEKPAHIITPAVHLRRDDVGRLFQEKLGIPYTEDIPTLTSTARKLLREVFLTATAPIGALGRGGVSSIIRRACVRAGVAPFGAHRLRHTMACEMVNTGVPLAEISQVLRHRSLGSTAIYARVDLDQLRQLAQPWLGRADR